MFSLIITIISIALVAVLALATLYYGGNSFTKGSSEAKAAALRNQGQQLLGAAEMYYLENQTWPQSPQALVDGGFLKSVPLAGMAISTAHAEVGWAMPSPGVPVFVYNDVAPEVCRQVNAKVYGLSGVLPQLHTQFMQQCAGADLSSLAVVTARNGKHLQDAASTLTVPVVATDIPDPEDATAWLVLPSADVVAAPGQGTGGAGSGAGPTPVVKGVLTASAEQLSYGAVATNTSASQTLTLTNAGPGVVVFQGAPGLSGSAGYSIVESTCTTLAVNATCTITVQFAPTEVGEGQTASLTWSSSAESSTGTLSLSGSAFNPVSLTGATLPSATVGTAYTPYNFANRLAVSNEQEPDFAQVTWTAPANLPSGMTFENGVLTGTPTSSTSARTLEVSAAYKGNEAVADFILTVLANPNGFSDIAAASNLSCGVTGDGAIKCWGSGGPYAALGNGSAANAAVNLPTQVTGITSGATRVVSGGDHACGIVNGGVQCWGSDQYHQLGNGGASSSNVPMAVTGIPETVTDMAAGLGHTCAITASGAVYCWGDNGNGRLGDGTTTSPRPSPVKVALAVGDIATGISASQVSTCASLSTGKVKCWGRNYAVTPTELPGLSNIVKVTAVPTNGTVTFHCGLTSTGDVYCWTSAANVTQITGVSGAQALVAGPFRTCAIQAGSVKCWAASALTATSANAAVTVTGIPGTPAKLAIGSGHICTQLTDSRVYCVGAGSSGQLGNGANVNATFPGPAVKVGG